MLAIRPAVFFEVGGFDEVNLPVAFNDVDLCLRLGDYGYRVVWTPFAELFHLESASRGKEDVDPVTRERLLREWEYLKKYLGIVAGFCGSIPQSKSTLSSRLFRNANSASAQKAMAPPVFAQLPT